MGAMYKELFLGVGLILFLCLWPQGRKFFMNLVLRCLFGLVCICVINECIAYFGGNISVKINEITTCISAFLGMGGIAALYALQLFFTVT